MQTRFMHTVQQRSEQALASGDLIPLETEETTVADAGLPFVVRWAAALATKDAATAPSEEAAEAPEGDAGDNVILPGGPRDPDFNPFLNPDPELTVGPIGDAHTVILNKFPVCRHHLVLARREFAEQLAPLEHTDFQVLAEILSGEGGLGYCNGGSAGGASQRHKHVQWLPPDPGNASLQALALGLPGNTAQGAAARHPALPFAHCFVRVVAERGADVGASIDSMQAGWQRACSELGLETGPDGLLPAFNLLISHGWLLLLPRRQEHFEGVSINALSFGGTIYVREPGQVDGIRRTGPLQVLASVSHPAA